eukprot:snap_masked-scaffold_6-processed-gene-0.43-mRNA-1 protein AED:1.00 eAED:1.00 QI:0/-1/0/0/-1/1/1/0/563
MENRIVSNENNERGIIRYFGTLPEKGDVEYYGIEWLEPANIEISTSSTFIEPKYGGRISFFKKNSKKLRFGKTFLSCLKEKYQQENSNVKNCSKVENEGLIYCKSREKVEIESVGFEEIRKQQTIKNLEIVSIDFFPVELISNEDFCIFSKVSELSLCKTFISRWETVSQILERTPNLKYLNLSNNFFLFDYEDENILKNNIETLVLNRIRVSDFSLTLNLIQNNFTFLRELFLSSNQLINEHFENLSVVFENVEILDLSENKISSLSILFDLQRIFPRIFKVNLSSNEINSIGSRTDFSIIRVQSLNLDKNKIPSIFPFLQLNKNISQLWITCFADDENLKKSFLNGRITLLSTFKKLNKLNGSELNQRHVKDQQLSFLHFLRSLAKTEQLDEHLDSALDKLKGYNFIPGKDCLRTNFAKINFVYPGLSELAHALEFNLSEILDPSSIGETSIGKSANVRTIKLSFRCFAGSGCNKGAKEAVLPTDFTVKNLKKLCEVWFKIKQMNQKLMFIAKNEEESKKEEMFQKYEKEIPVELDDEDMKLFEFAVLHRKVPEIIVEQNC